MGTRVNCKNDFEDIFGVGEFKGNLREKAIRGGLNTMVGEVVSFVLRIGSTVLLARILMPEDFGLIGMVTALTAIAERFKDLGLSTATVQQKGINHEQVSTLFWINVCLGLGIMLVLDGLSGVIAWFYGDPRLVRIIVVLSATFFFGGLTIQHQALLRRRMRFGQLAFIQVASNLLSLAIGVVLAWQGFEYWALVLKEVLRAVFGVCGVWILCGWYPGLPSSKASIGSMMRLGRHITGFDMVYFLSRNLDQILIGRVWGANQLGFYRQAYQLVTVPITQFQFPMDYVALPTLSTLQDDPERYRKYYRKTVSALAFVSMPIAIFLVIFAEDVVGLLLGQKWIGSVGIFRCLAIAAFIQPVESTCGFVMVACGKTARYFWLGVLTGVGLTGAFITGISFGPIGVAVGYTVFTYLSLIPSLVYSFRGTPVSISIFFESIARPVCSSLVMGVLLLTISQTLSGFSLSLRILLLSILGFLVYCAMFLVLPKGKEHLTEYLSYPFLLLKPKYEHQRMSP